MARKTRHSTGVGGFGARGSFPGSERRVVRDGGGVLLASGEQFTAAEPAYSRLDGTFLNADVFGELLVADFKGGASAGPLRRGDQKKQENDGGAHGPDKNAQQHSAGVVATSP